MGDHDAGVWGFMVIAPCNACEGGWRVTGIGVYDGDVTFLVFATEFRYEGEVPGTIEGGLDLECKLGECVSSCIASVVITVREDAEC